MSSLDSSIRVDGEQQQLKQCRANLYESDLARLLLGDSFHPGGLELTRQLGLTLGLSPLSRVLDVACGKGITAIFLAKEFGCEVVGIDYGEQNIATARSLAKTEHLDSTVRFERSDAETFRFPISRSMPSFVSVLSAPSPTRSPQRKSCSVFFVEEDK